MSIGTHGSSFKIFSPDGRSAKVQRFCHGWEAVAWVAPPVRGPRYMHERRTQGDRLVVELTGEEREAGLVARLVAHEALDGSWARPCAYATATIAREALGVSWVNCDVWDPAIWSAAPERGP